MMKIAGKYDSEDSITDDVTAGPPVGPDDGGNPQFMALMGSVHSLPPVAIIYVNALRIVPNHRRDTLALHIRLVAPRRVELPCSVARASTSYRCRTAALSCRGSASSRRRGLAMNRQDTSALNRRPHLCLAPVH